MNIFQFNLTETGAVIVLSPEVLAFIQSKLGGNDPEKLDWNTPAIEGETLAQYVQRNLSSWPVDPDGVKAPLDHFWNGECWVPAGYVAP